MIFTDFSELFSHIRDYKLSKPNNQASSIGKVFSECGIYYFYDSGTGKVVMIDKTTAQLIDLLLTSDKCIADYFDYINYENVEIKELLDIFNREDLFKGFQVIRLCSDAFIEYVENQIRMGTSQIILELTGNCNLRCAYCIYQDGNSNNRAFHSNNMSAETAKAAIDYMKQYGDAEEVFITFYGGEPLIAFDLLSETIEYSKSVLGDRKLHFSFTTNLILLTPEMACYFMTVKNLSILCSIDGPKEIHDQYRVDINGNGSFDDAYNNFRMLNEYAAKASTEMHISVNAVYMPPFGKGKVQLIDEFFTNLDFVQSDFKYQLGYANMDSIPKELLDHDFAGDTSFRDWQDEQILEDFELATNKETTLFQSFDRIHKRRITVKANDFIPLNGCCVPGFRRLFVATDGLFSPCERIGNCPSIGNANEGVDLNVIFEKYIYEFSEQWTSICAGCWAAKLCTNCYVDRMDENGVRKPNMADCEYYRGLSERSLAHYHHILRTSPDKLDILNYELST